MASLSIESIYLLSNIDTTMSAFSCPVKSIKLAGKGQGQVELHFLPFQVGPRHCTLIFVNEAVGEFLYAVDAVALEPEASTLPHTATEHSTCMNSAAAAGEYRWSNDGDWYQCWYYIDELVQEWRNSSALAVELRLSCINPPIWYSAVLL